MHSSTSWGYVLILKILKQKNNISDFQSCKLLLEFKNWRQVEGQDITLSQVYVDYDNRNGSIDLPSSHSFPCLITLSISPTPLSIGSSLVFSQQLSQLQPT